MPTGSACTFIPIPAGRDDKSSADIGDFKIYAASAGVLALRKDALVAEGAPLLHTIQGLMVNAGLAGTLSPICVMAMKDLRENLPDDAADANAPPKPKIAKFDDDGDATDDDSVGDLPLSKLSIDSDDEEDQEFSQQMW